MRVAICTDTYLPQVNGLVVAVKNFSEQLLRRGHDVAIFAPGDETCVKSIGGVGVHYFRGRTFRSYPDYIVTLRMGSIAGAVREFEPDIVHVHTPFIAGLAGWRAKRRLDAPMLISFHTPIDRYVEYLSFARGPILPLLSFAASRYQNWFHSRGDACTFPTRRAMDFINLSGRVKTVVQPNGVDTDRFNPQVDESPARRDFELGDGPLVLYTGRVGMEKRVDVLLRGFSRIVKKVPGIRLVICGDGPQRMYLERLSVQLGISGSTTFTGFIPDHLFPSFYATADVFVQPSPVETQSLVVLEAMASGLPVVGANAGAVPETIRDGENGALFAPGDDRELANRLETLLGDDSLRHRMSRAAVSTAGQFSWDRCSDRLEGLYRELIEARGV